MASLFGWLNIDKVKKLFREEIDFDPTKFLTNSLLNIKNEKQLLNKLLYWDLKYFLVDHNLNYTDKMSMAHGVEVRVPFLDKNLVEFGTMLPVSLKMKGVNTKYLLRKVAERYLPSEVIYRSKTGFGVPVRDWVDNDLKSKITDCTMNNDSMFSKIFDLEAVNNLVNENQTKKIDAAYPILALIAINSWLNQFYDNN